MRTEAYFVRSNIVAWDEILPSSQVLFTYTKAQLGLIFFKFCTKIKPTVTFFFFFFNFGTQHLGFLATSIAFYHISVLGMRGNQNFENSKWPTSLRPWQTRTHFCGHIVADTNVSPFARPRNICCGHKFCVRDTKNFSDFVQKHFVSARKCFPVCAA